jgi:hypothetical protein
MTLAERIVNRLIEGKRPPIPVKVRLPDGSVIDAEFNGYYDLRSINRGHVPSIGRPTSYGALTHGLLGKEERIETPIPSPEEWESDEVETPAKAAFWPTM